MQGPWPMAPCLQCFCTHELHDFKITTDLHSARYSSATFRKKGEEVGRTGEEEREDEEKNEEEHETDTFNLFWHRLSIRRVPHKWRPIEHKLKGKAPPPLTLKVAYLLSIYHESMYSYWFPCDFFPARPNNTCQAACHLAGGFPYWVPPRLCAYQCWFLLFLLFWFKDDLWCGELRYGICQVALICVDFRYFPLHLWLTTCPWKLQGFIFSGSVSPRDQFGAITILQLTLCLLLRILLLFMYLLLCRLCNLLLCCSVYLSSPFVVLVWLWRCIQSKRRSRNWHLRYKQKARAESMRRTRFVCCCVFLFLFFWFTFVFFVFCCFLLS